VDEDPLAGTHTDINGRSKQMLVIRENKENAPEIQDDQERGGKEEGGGGGGGERRRYSSCGQIHIHPYRTYKLEGLCLHCRRRRDTRLASFEVNAIRDSVQRESMLGVDRLGMGRRFRALSHIHEEIGGRQEGNRTFKALPQPVVSLPVSLLGRRVHFEEGRARGGSASGEEEGQQQQTPWRLTLPPAEPPRRGWGLAGMRDGEWI
jgi:hypothetical protein